jgi:site-specific DNA recombinase
MKRAILYIRVSTDEQADKGYSLGHQQERLQKYCDLQGIKVVASYKEDHSAKSFDRPQFKKMLEFLKRNKNFADLLLFTKWDRFSRNAGDAYSMISTLNKKGIEPQGIEQQLDLSVPENKLMLAFYLAAPEVENDRRSLNVIVGMRRAMKEGRYLGVAPKGYINTVNELGRPTLKIHEGEANIMRWVFNEVAKGNKTASDLWSETVAKGLPVSRGYFFKMLRKQMYCGKITIAKYKDEAEQIVKSQHEPLVSEELFNKVQNILDGRKKNIPTKNTRREEFPLRGFLNCKLCGNLITASNSRGTGGLYQYYHCTKGCKERIKAEVVNNYFIDLLDTFSIKNKALKNFKVYVNDIYNKNNSANKEGALKTKLDIEKIETRLTNAKKLLMDGEITGTDYKEMKEMLEPELFQLKQMVVETNIELNDIKEYLAYTVKYLENLGLLYKQSDIGMRQQILSSIFSEKLVFEKDTVRTLHYNNVVSLAFNISNTCSESKKKTDRLKIEQSPLVRGRRFELPSPCEHHHLKVARLPISPPPYIA